MITEIRKACEFLMRVPENWIKIEEETEAVVVRPISAFDADPDVRAAAVKSWAQEEVSRLVDLIPGFNAAPIDKTDEEDPA